jgi:hypothetical protein
MGESNQQRARKARLRTVPMRDFVLIVDDEPLILALAVDFLRELGCDVIISSICFWVKGRTERRDRKIMPIGFGLAIASAILYDPLNQTGSGLILNVPLRFEFNKDFRVNVNFGAQYYSGGDPHGLYGTAGVGASWTFVPHWSVISEMFALMGPGQTNPRFQSGLRYIAR